MWCWVPTLANTDIPNDIDTIRDLILGLTAVVADTNRRVARMETAFIAAQQDAAAWNRAQVAIARTMGVDIPDVETASNPDPVAKPEPQTGQTTLTGFTEPTGAKDSLAGASTGLGVDHAWGLPPIPGMHPLDTSTPPDPPNPFLALTPDRPQSVSGETVSKPKEIDPDTLDWFVSDNGNYYVHGEPGEPDRRATAAEVRAINNGSKADRPHRKRIR